jgi:subfamily B ATP-binding cassette protein HlyB/CyaB
MDATASFFSVNAPAIDTGLQCLVALCRFHQIAVEPAQLAREFGQPGELFSVTDMQRAAKHLGLKCRHVENRALTPDFLLPDPATLPAIFRTHDGHWLILARRDIDNNKLLIHDLRQSQPQVINEDTFRELWSGELLLLTRRRGVGENLQQVFDISWFIPALLKYRKLFGEVLLASFFLQLFALATPLFFQVVMDKVLVHHGMSTLDVLAIGFFVVIVFETLLGGIRNYVFAHTTNRVDVELGAKLFRHLLGLPLAYFQARSTGDSVARVRELDSLRQFITGSALTLVIDLGFTFVFLAFMLYYSVSLSVVVIATIPMYILLSVLITPVLRARLDDKFKHSAINQSFLVESVTGAETVKSLALEPQLQRRWEEQLANYVTSSFRAQHLNNNASQIAGLINKLMTLGIIWWGAQLVMRGELSVGQLVAFNMLAGRISGPILKLVQLAQDFQQAKLSVDRLGDILNTPREPGFNPNRSTLPTLKGDVIFEHARFRYRHDGPIVLDDMNLHIRPGEIIGIVGQSGSGKSTLTKLVQRLYVPEAGRVLMDGVDLSNVDTAWLSDTSAWCCKRASCSGAVCVRTSPFIIRPFPWSM